MKVAIATLADYLSDLEVDLMPFWSQKIVDNMLESVVIRFVRFQFVSVCYKEEALVTSVSSPSYHLYNRLIQANDFVSRYAKSVISKAEKIRQFNLKQQQTNIFSPISEALPIANTNASSSTSPPKTGFFGRMVQQITGSSTGSTSPTPSDNIGMI
jgi:hypothetical protein